MAQNSRKDGFVPQSSAVSRVSYNASLQRLSVAFRSGATYTFDGVSRQKFSALKRASSVGRFINKNLKPSPPRMARSHAPRARCGRR